MKNSDHPRIKNKKLPSVKRQAVGISEEGLIKTGCLQAKMSLPLIVDPCIERLSLVGRANSNREFIETQLLKHGGILFPNFQVNGVAEFEEFIMTISRELLEYKERSSPRSWVSGNIYTSTDYRADQSIFLHN